MTSEQRNPIERAINVFVYVPLGAGLRAIEATPAVLDACKERGEAAIDSQRRRLNQQINNARFLGQYALHKQLPKVRASAGDRVATARRAVTGVASIAARPTPGRAMPGRDAPPAVPPAPEPRRETTTADVIVPAVVPAPAPSVAAAPPNGSRAAREDLPIPGYDALSASQVVERLTGLGDDELDAVRAYEAAHRNRRTILGKIEQLAAPSA